MYVDIWNVALYGNKQIKQKSYFGVEQVYIHARKFIFHTQDFEIFSKLRNGRYFYIETEQNSHNHSNITAIATEVDCQTTKTATTSTTTTKTYQLL